MYERAKSDKIACANSLMRGKNHLISGTDNAEQDIDATKRLEVCSILFVAIGNGIFSFRSALDMAACFTTHVNADSRCISLVLLPFD